MKPCKILAHPCGGHSEGYAEDKATGRHEAGWFTRQFRKRVGKRVGQKGAISGKERPKRFPTSRNRAYRGERVKHQEAPRENAASLESQPARTPWDALGEHFGDVAFVALSVRKRQRVQARRNLGHLMLRPQSVRNVRAAVAVTPARLLGLRCGRSARECGTPAACRRFRGRRNRAARARCAPG